MEKKMLLACLLCAVLMMGCFGNPYSDRNQGRLTACRSNLKNIATASGMYATDNGGMYESSMALLTPEYLKHIPTCPAEGRDTYSSSWVVWNAPARSGRFAAPESPAPAASRPRSQPQRATPLSSAAGSGASAYTVMCAGTNHDRAYQSRNPNNANYPQYTSRDGLIEP